MVWESEGHAVTPLYLNPPQPVEREALELVAAEREKQTRDWTPEHDDSHKDGALAVMAAVLAVDGTDAQVADPIGRGSDENHWGLLGKHGYQGTHPNEIRCLVIAAALLVAEIERIQRADAILAGEKDDG